MNVVLTIPTSRGHRLSDLRRKCGGLRNEIFEACCELQRNPAKVDLQRLMRALHELQVAEAECRDHDVPADAA